MNLTAAFWQEVRNLTPSTLPLPRLTFPSRLYPFPQVIPFAARGAGRPGMPPVRAPLSDPRATPADSLVPALDVALRAVCTAILQVGT